MFKCLDFKDIVQLRKYSQFIAYLIILSYFSQNLLIIL